MRIFQILIVTAIYFVGGYYFYREGYKQANRDNAEYLFKKGVRNEGTDFQNGFQSCGERIDNE